MTGSGITESARHQPDTNQSELRKGRSALPPADYIGETRRLYDSLGYDGYRWADKTDEPAAFVPLSKPLSECRILLVASGGVYRHGQIAFHTKDDTSIRVIPTDTPTSELRTAHFAYDQADARVDPNCVFPLDVLRDMVMDGEVGELCEEALTFMGGIYSTRKLEAETVPRILERCRAQEPDLVLLVPV